MIIAPKSSPVIISSNIVEIEAGVVVYNANSSYVLLDIVQVNSPTHRKYKALQDVPVGVNPVDDVNPSTGKGVYWFDMGATNYGKAFDELGSSTCENPDVINFKFQTSDIDVLLLENLTATTVRIQITNEDTAAILQDETYDTTTREVYDWLDWTVAGLEFNTSFYKMLNMAYNTTMEIWINNPGLNASVGHIVFGRGLNYGLSLMDPQPVASRRGIISKTRDANGNIVSRRKARYRRMTISCLINYDSIDTIEDRVEKVIDTPCIIVGDEKDGGLKALTIFGEIKDHDTPISVDKVVYSLEVEGYL